MEKHEFKPKEWVLVKDDEEEKWKLDIFSHFNDGGIFPYICVGNRFSKCIPYEGNEALLGTTDVPKEKEDWQVGDKVEVLCANDDKWHPGKIIDIDSSRIMQFKVESSAFKEWRGNPLWCAADQLRKPEEKPESAKGWRPKEGEAVKALVSDEWQAATLILDDHTDCAPYRVRLQNGDKAWCTEEEVRPAQKEPFKFGDKVKCREDGEWMDGLFIMDDHTTIRYLVYLPSENDTVWLCEEDIRHA